jgi:chromosome segregation ATPase
MVERFHCTDNEEYDWTGLHSNPNGDLVLYEDYQSLQAQCDRHEETIAGLENALAAMKEENDKLSELFNAAGVDNNNLHSEVDNLNAALQFKNNVIDAQQHNLATERARVAELELLVQQHQTYQTKEGIK